MTDGVRGNSVLIIMKLMIKLSRGWQDMTLRTTSAWHLFLQIEFYQKIVCCLIYNLSMIGFALQWQSWLVMMHTLWSTKPKVFTIWSLKWSEVKSHPVMSDSLWSHGVYSPCNSPGQYTGVGSLSLLQRSSQPRDQTQVSCIAGRFFTNWAIREAPCPLKKTFFFKVGDAQGILACCSPWSRK